MRNNCFAVLILLLKALQVCSIQKYFSQKEPNCPRAIIYTNFYIDLENRTSLDSIFVNTLALHKCRHSEYTNLLFNELALFFT